MPEFWNRFVPVLLTCAAANVAAAPSSENLIARQPVSFYQNRGQAPPDVLWEAHGNGFAAFFQRDGFVLRVRAGRELEQKITLEGVDDGVHLQALDVQPGRISFIPDGDRRHWHGGLPTYSRLYYRNVYPGIDLVFYGNHGKLEYDFVVAAGADPRRIRLRADLVTGRVTPAGELQLGDGAEALLHRPSIYQNLASGRAVVSGRFVRRGDGFGFSVAAFDRTRPLIIDPSINLLYATYLGGIHDDQAYAIALDAQNNAYIVGNSVSQDYPVSASAIEGGAPYAGGRTFVTKMNPSGVLLYSTFIGGTMSGVDHADAIAVDKTGNAWVAGAVSSSNPTSAPTTSNAYQSVFPSQANESMFFFGISSDGSTLLYGSYFAGAGGATISPPNAPGPVSSSIAVAANGHIYLGGEAGSGLPTTTGAYLTTIATGKYAPFVAVFDTTQTGANQLLASTYLQPAAPTLPSDKFGTLNAASFSSMVLDASGNPWVVGGTFASNFPTTSNAVQKSITLGTCSKPGDPLDRAAFVAKLSADLKTLLYGSYLSGGTAGANPSSSCDEFATSAALDGGGNIYVTGLTSSTAFPTTTGAYQKTAVVNAVGLWQFLAKISSNGNTLDWATYVGQGGGSGSGPFVGLDGQTDVWLGSQASYMPTTSNALQSHLNPNQGDIGVAEFSNDGSTLLYGTYLPQVAQQYPYPFDLLRGFAVDKQGNTYFTGSTEGAVIPVTANAYQPKFANGDASPDGNDAFFMVLGTGAITGIGPASGGNTGDTSITINGAGFQSGATCALAQGATTIQATSVTVSNNGTTVTCNFALNGAATGTYDVSVTNPGGTASIDKGAFTISPGGQPNVWTMLSGRSAIRVGTPSTVFLNYGNNGTENAYLTTLWFVLPSTWSFTVSGLTNPSDMNCPALSLQPVFFSQNGFTYVPLLVPVIAAGAVRSIAITVTAPSVSSPVELDGYAEAPWFSSLSAATQTLTSAASSPGGVSSSCVAGAGISDCLGPMSSEAQPAIAAYLSQFGITDPSIANDTTARLATDLKNILSSAAPTAVMSWELIFDEVAADIATTRFGITGQCAPPFTPPDVDPEPESDPLPDDCPNGREWGNAISGGSTSPCKPTQPVNAIDPNDKTGPAGDGSSKRYIRASSPFVYTVAFENQATATAPAAQVVITDVLDPARLDLSTLSLGNISFGNTVITPPANTNNFNTLYSINSSLSVRIQGSLNTDNNTLKWTFTSIDPSTGLPPSDPTVGFLPPDSDGVKGQGSVAFSVLPKAGQTTGAQITNQASVVFDANAPIDTPTWLNTLDVDVPHSAVTALPSQESQTTFAVSWSGTDTGSGIATYSIYVSDNGGAYSVFQNNVTATTANFTGQAGHTYGFYSIATDLAGNVEPAKTSADTSTTVAGATGTSTTTTAANASATYSPNSQTVTLNATVTSNGGTVNAGSVTFTAVGVSVSGNVVNGAASANLTIPAGTTAANYAIKAVYNAAGGFVTSTDTTHKLTIQKATPTVTWANPADMPFGGALGAGQLDAKANTAGAFVYNPAAGTVLLPGSAQTLSAVFTPTDATDYNSATGSAKINVLAPPASGPADLIVTKTLNRDPKTNQIIAVVTVANAGGSTAAAVQLTVARIASTATSSTLPIALGSIASGKIAKATLNFPAATGTTGQATTMTLSGTWPGGSFTSTSRITLP